VLVYGVEHCVVGCGFGDNRYPGIPFENCADANSVYDVAICYNHAGTGHWGTSPKGHI
jgi:hypothetical protein